jgi:hypothetical protein
MAIVYRGAIKAMTVVRVLCSDFLDGSPLTKMDFVLNRPQVAIKANKALAIKNGKYSKDMSSSVVAKHPIFSGPGSMPPGQEETHSPS